MCAHRILRRCEYYVTTPIFYPNAGVCVCLFFIQSLTSAAPHIGHLHSLVTADVFARYQRITDPSLTVHYLTGTDDHGLKIQQAAAAAGLPPRQFCDGLSAKFKVHSCLLSFHKFILSISGSYKSRRHQLYRIFSYFRPSPSSYRPRCLEQT